MKNLLKQYKVLIVLGLIAICMSSCYVEYPHGPYGGGYYHRPHYHHHYGY
ncbi:MAG TPA: hypothetical protein VGB84_05765 [Arachidicoccus sp.]